MDKTFDQLATPEEIETTIKSLQANGIQALPFETADQAKQHALSLIPIGAEIFTMTSVTLETIGLAKEINESGKFNSVRLKLSLMDKTQKREKAKLGAAPEYTIGSAHAVTQDGKVLIASNTGSQLAAYVYGAEKVIWIVGAQKIVKTVDDGIKRIYDYVLPLESERAQKAYGSGSNVSKLLIINKEINKESLTLLIVKEKLGF